ETGGERAGTTRTNVLGTPSTANALRYFNDYVAQVTASTFFFESFDEPWKANPQTAPKSVEPHFGLPRSGLVGSPGPPAPLPPSRLGPSPPRAGGAWVWRGFVRPHRGGHCGGGAPPVGPPGARGGDPP